MPVPAAAVSVAVEYVDVTFRADAQRVQRLRLLASIESQPE